ncbi:MAG: FAD:protein FMN transferase [Acidobacteria bacterium]|nr:FAD:protein FMN transferase [Acidobacteriota bacterium]
MEWRKTNSSFPCMGTLMRITAWKRGDATEALVAAKRRFEALDARLSHYKPDSEINRLKPGVATLVSRELFDVLTFASRLSLLSGGAFDVTVRGKSVGYQYMALGNRTVTLTKEGMLLDLGGIAKGFANDEVAKVLREAGVKRFLIASSGDVLTGDAPPGEAGWVVEFQGIQRRMTRRAVSTSGNTYQPGHVLDPRRMEKVLKQETVSVLAPDSMTADALATACLILDPLERAQLTKSYKDVEVVSA